MARASERKTAGRWSVAGPGTAQGRDRGRTEDRSGARMGGGSPEGAPPSSGENADDRSDDDSGTHDTGDWLREGERERGTVAGSRDVTVPQAAVGGEGGTAR